MRNRKESSPEHCEAGCREAEQWLAVGVSPRTRKERK